MDRDEFMELVYETFADEPDNVLANGIIEAADAYVEHEKAQLSKEGTTSDLISRQAAIDALDKRFDNIPMEQTAEILMLRKDLRELPTIQPEPHEGTWVYGEDSTADCVDGYRCSQCGFFVPWDYNHKLIDYINDYAYCPHCGTKMITK